MKQLASETVFPKSELLPGGDTSPEGTCCTQLRRVYAGAMLGIVQLQKHGGCEWRMKQLSGVHSQPVSFDTEQRGSVLQSARVADHIEGNTGSRKRIRNSDFHCGFTSSEYGVETRKVDGWLSTALRE
jgi:hypothetical protein